MIKIRSSRDGGRRRAGEMSAESEASCSISPLSPGQRAVCLGISRPGEGRGGGCGGLTFSLANPGSITNVFPTSRQCLWTRRPAGERLRRGAIKLLTEAPMFTGASLQSRAGVFLRTRRSCGAPARSPSLCLAAHSPSNAAPQQLEPSTSMSRMRVTFDLRLSRLRAECPRRG